MSKNKVENAIYTAIPPLISVAVAFLASAFFVLWSKDMPLQEYFFALGKLASIIATESFSTPLKFMEVLVYATPLLFCALAHTICFRCGMFNIGVEGQFMLGMVFAGIVGQFQGLPPLLHGAMIFTCGILGGGLWAALPGTLKAKLGINEVVICIMANFIAMHLLNYIALRSTIADVEATATYIIQPSAQLTRFSEASRLNISTIVVLIVAIAIYLMLFHTQRGFQIRAVGLNATSAQAGGINIVANMVLALVLSGAVAGLGGALHVAGVQHRLISVSAFPNYGMDAIAISLLSKKNPLACILVAVLFGALRNSSRMFQIEGISKDTVYMIQAIIIFFVAADLISKYLHQRRKEQ